MTISTFSDTDSLWNLIRLEEGGVLFSFEKKNNMAIIPCYNDNDITLKKLIQNELGGFKNLNPNIVNMILNYSNLNRKTVLNNLEKIKTFYENKISKLHFSVALSSI